jgi:hypothetical protein
MEYLIDILKDMGLSKRTRSSSSDGVNIHTEAPVPDFMDARKMSSATAMRESRQGDAPSNPAKRQKLYHEHNVDAYPPPWLLEPPAQVISSRSLSFNEKTGWIVLVDLDLGPGPNDIQLCWLPVEIRGDAFHSHQSMFVIASELNHQLTIIDFEPMLTMLRQLGVISGDVR